MPIFFIRYEIYFVIIYKVLRGVGGETPLSYPTDSATLASGYRSITGFNIHQIIRNLEKELLG